MPRQIDVAKVEVEITCPPEQVGKAYKIKVENDKIGLEDVVHFVPMSTVFEIHDDFIVIAKWQAIEKGLRF